MKLLHVISSLEIGGAQRLLADLLPIQKEQGMDVSLLVYEDIDNAFTQKIKAAGIPVLSLGQTHYKSPLNIWRIRRIIRDYDVVHVHLFPSLYWVALASIGLKHTKLVWTEHSTNNQRRSKKYLRPIERWMYRRYAGIISISAQTQEALQTWLYSSDERFHVIPNGIDLTRYANLSVPVIPKSLIMISRFVPAKDQETVIRAMKHIDPGAMLRFVGNGETMERCQQLAKKEGVADRIEFLGKRADVIPLIAQSYIGIQSSHWEGFGLTAVELMAAGKPVVASNVEGLRQVVEGAGEIFEVGDEKQLAAIVNHLLADHASYQTLSQRCKVRAQQYDIQTLSKKYMKVYIQ